MIRREQNPSPPNQPILPSLLVAALLIVLYTLTSSGRFHIIDEVSLFAVTESLGQRGALDTNAIAWTQWVNSPGEVLGAFGEDGNVYSKKGPAPAFLALPWYWLLHFGARLGAAWGLVQGTLLWNGMVTGATAFLLSQTVTALGYSGPTAVRLALLFGSTTIAWPYATLGFGEPLSTFSLLLAVYGLVRWRRSGRNRLLWWTGLGAGLLVASVTAHLLLVPFLFLYPLLVSRPTGEMDGVRFWAGRIVPLIVPLILALSLLALYNQIRFGAPLETGYHFDGGEGFSTPLFEGLWGLLVSPYRGLFWHTPLFFASLWLYPSFLRRHRAEALLIAGLSLTLTILYSLWWMWWGGFSWGPRFLVPLTPLWVLVLAPLLSDWSARSNTSRLGRITFLILVLISFLVQLGSVMINFVNWEIRLRSLYPTDWLDPLRFGPPAQSLWALADSPIFGVWRLLFEDLMVNTDLAWLRSDGTVLWLLPLIGGLSATLTLLVLHRHIRQGKVDAATWLALIGTLLFIPFWLTQVADDPHYGETDRDYRAALGAIDLVGVGDTLITVAPFHYQIPMNEYSDPSVERIPIFGFGPEDLDEPGAQRLFDMATEHRSQVWAISAGVAPADPNNQIERALAADAYRADERWFDDFRLIRFAGIDALEGVAVRPLEPILSLDANRIQLTGLSTRSEVEPGTLLPVEIHYRVEQSSQPLRWFVQLLSAEGAPLSLFDGAPQGGYRSFETIEQGDYKERVALAIPSAAVEGDYRLIAGLYRPDAEGGVRLQSENGRDFVDLGVVSIGEIERAR